MQSITTQSESPVELTEIEIFHMHLAQINQYLEEFLCISTTPLWKRFHRVGNFDLVTALSNLRELPSGWSLAQRLTREHITFYLERRARYCNKLHSQDYTLFTGQIHTLYSKLCAQLTHLRDPQRTYNLRLLSCITQILQKFNHPSSTLWAPLNLWEAFSASRETSDIKPSITFRDLHKKYSSSIAKVISL